MTSANFKEDEIHSILESLNAGKTHGWDSISIKIITICGKAILKIL